jgi:hypothetical protein
MLMVLVLVSSHHAGQQNIALGTGVSWRLRGSSQDVVP